MPAKKHNFTVTEIKAGAMVIASVLVFAGFTLAVLKLWPEPAERIHYVYFKDTMGLTLGADVRFGGVKVGRVRSITADISKSLEELGKNGDNTGEATAQSASDNEADKAADDGEKTMQQSPIIRVEMSVEPQIPINEASVAYIGQTTLTSEKHLEITTGLPQLRMLASGEEIPVGSSGSIFDQAGSIASSVASAIEGVKALLGVDQALAASPDGELDTTLVTLLTGVDKAVNESTGLVADARDIMGQYRGDIGTIINEVVKIETSAHHLVTELNGLVAESRPDIQNTVQQLPTLMARVDALADDLELIASALQSTLDAAEDTIQDNRPVIEETIVDLRDTVGNLKEFSRNLAEQPESVIWGKSQKERGGK